MPNSEIQNQSILAKIIALTPKNLLFQAYAVAAIALSIRSGMPGLEVFVTNIGINLLSDLIIKLRKGEVFSDEVIMQQIKDAIEQSEIIDLTSQNQVMIGRLFRRFDILKTSIDELHYETVELLIDQTNTFRILNQEFKADLIKISENLIRQLQNDDLVIAELAVLQKKIDTIDKFVGLETALSKYPKTKRRHVDLPLIGRQDEWDWLVGKHQDNVDCLLVGQPGSGKTFLVRKLISEFAGYFVVGTDRQQILREILAREPKVLVVDDAHLNQELIADLRQLRDQHGFQFTIVATCWPTFRTNLAGAMDLMSHECKELLLLTRKEIKEILDVLGIVEPRWLVKEIIDQAEGKPGLAVTLVDAYERGANRDIFSGSILINGILEDYLDEPNGEGYKRDILAALSLGGDKGMSLQVVAPALEITRREVENTITNLTTAGIVFELPNGNISVRPRALAHALLREVFFTSTRQPASVEQLLWQVPDIVETVITLIAARKRGANIPDNQIISLLERRKTIVLAYDHSLEEAWSAFASLGIVQSLWLLKEHPDYLISVASTTLYLAPKETIRALLNQSVGDDRPLNSNTDHPLRILKDWTSRLGDPNILYHREILLEVILDWYNVTRNTHVALTVIGFIFNPDLEATEVDPADEDQLAFRRSNFNKFGIDKLLILWNKALPGLQAMEIRNWEPLIDLVQRWMLVDSHGRAEIDNTDNLITPVIQKLCADISSLSPSHYGLGRALIEIATLRKFSLSINIVEEFEILYPPQDRGEISDIKAKEEINQLKVKKLAESWLQREPVEVINEILHYQELAVQAGIKWPDYTLSLASWIASDCADPVQWVDAIMKVNSSSPLLGPFLHTLHKTSIEIWKPRLVYLLKVEANISLALYFLLKRPDLDAEMLDRTLALVDNFPSIAEILFTENIPDEIVDALLNHKNENVRLHAAKGLWWLHEKNLLPDNKFYKVWSQILVESDSDSWLLQQVLQSDSDIAYRWLKRVSSGSYSIYYSKEKLLRIAVANISLQQIWEIINGLERPQEHCELLRIVVGTDPDIFKGVLSNDHFKRCHMSLIPLVTDAWWPSFVLIALDQGYSATDIAQASVSSPMYGAYFVSEQGNVWKSYIEAFQHAKTDEDHRIQEVAEYGRRIAEERYQAEQERQRQRAVFGDSRFF